MRSAVAFLTTIGGPATPHRGTLSWFPLVGTGIGAVTGSVWWGAQELWPPLVAAAVVVVVDLALTGVLHVDGLADTADGLLPPVPRERRLAIMSDPTVGSFALAVVTGVVLMRFSVFASLDADVWLVAGAWCGARSLMAVAARTLPYARGDHGLARSFTGRGWRFVAAQGLIATVALGMVAGGGRIVLALAGGLVAGTLVLGWAHRRLGGFTGDVLGAAGLVAETTALVLAAGAS